MVTSEQTLTWLVLGAILGMFAGLLLRGRVSALVAAFAGAIGAIVAGLLFGLLRLETPPALTGQIVIRAMDLVLALVGAAVAVLVVYVYRRFRRSVI